jgi:hypothetical protein
MLQRWRELLRRRQLLFTPKQYPKYLNNKLRVFTPSSSLKVALVFVALYSLSVYHIHHSASRTIFPPAKYSSPTPTPPSPAPNSPDPLLIPCFNYNIQMENIIKKTNIGIAVQ